MISVRQALDSDLSFIIDLDRHYSPVFRKPEAYERLRDPAIGLLHVAIADSHAVGFAAFSCVLEEATLVNLVVQPEARRGGVARALLSDAHRCLAERGCRRVLLEVRESNGAARSTYEVLGYRIDGRRRGYYPGVANTPREDAVLMSCDLESPHANP